MIYLIIFLAKLLENMLATLRIILIANNKKFIGAILTFIISIIWILSVSYIVFDFKDYLKIIAFALGSGIGSYIGSILEEKIALGCIIISFKVQQNNLEKFNEIFKYFEKIVIKTNNSYKFEIECKRKKQNSVIKRIKNIDNSIKINIIKVYNC